MIASFRELSLASLQSQNRSSAKNELPLNGLVSFHEASGVSKDTSVKLPLRLSASPNDYDAVEVAGR
jgi:hypothetical protein